MDNLPREVINIFTSLTERVANSKTNILDFGSEEITFYWGEIHIIKMIRDYSGILSSEIAHRFGTARAVVHRTSLKLEERKLVMKTQNDADKKRAPPFLTEKGR